MLDVGFCENGVIGSNEFESFRAAFFALHGAILAHAGTWDFYGWLSGWYFDTAVRRSHHVPAKEA